MYKILQKSGTIKKFRRITKITVYKIVLNFEI